MVVLASVMVMFMGDRITIRLAGPCALPYAERAALRKSFHVVVVTFLRAAHVLFKAQHLGPVFA